MNAGSKHTSNIEALFGPRFFGIGGHRTGSTDVGTKGR
jgi:hypothetical protein